ncbi:MAG: hypothetical protein HYY06_00670 [Deltaproteobacteria bacterium]|nr:hypothetical protein [Deltaproteobacteria bacterium]
MTDRLPDVDVLLDRHRDRFRRLLQAIVAEEAGEDPFAIPLERFRSASADEKAELVRRAAIIARDRVDRELRSRGAAWVVVAGDDVVASSPDPETVPAPEDVLRLGEPLGLVAYLFEAPLIEEVGPGVAAWARLTGADRYPTITLVVHDEQVRTVVADLDTGAHATLIDDRLASAPTATWFAGRHLGDQFLWAPILLDIEVPTTGGAPIRKAMAVRQVRDWALSPFVRINGARRALAGRDLLRAMGLRVELRSADSETRVLGTD